MGTSKDDTIKFRVNAQLKADFKAYTELNNTNMSEVFTQHMIKILEKEKFKKENQKKLERRANKTDIRLLNIKSKLINTKQKPNKFNIIGFFKMFFLI